MDSIFGKVLKGCGCLTLGFFLLCIVLAIIGAFVDDDDEDEKNEVVQAVLVEKNDSVKKDSVVVNKPLEGDPYKELDELIGLEQVKEEVRSLANFVRLQKQREAKGLKTPKMSYHLVFYGSPGTGKTTVARIVGRIYKDLGVLKSGHTVETDRGGLVAQYVGQTATKTDTVIQKALDGVLFIDEAYALADDRGGSFGDEAINTIVQEMENRREDLVVIFAGYPEEMERFLDKNPGLRSRIAFHVPFADYSAEELCDIAMLIGRQKGVSFSADAVEKLYTVFEVARLQPDFGNGRYARNAVEQAKMNMASRLLTMDLAAVTKETLTIQDKAQSSKKGNRRKKYIYRAYALRRLRA